MSDLIERKAMIDYLVELWRGSKTDEAEMIVHELIDKVSQLPSAQPEILACGEGVLTQSVQDGSRLVQDCISRQAAIDAVDEQVKYCDKALTSFDISLKDEYAVKVEKASLNALKETLEYLPSAQPERKTGRWERHYSRPNVYADLWWHCSECGYKNNNDYANVYHHYCPNCGAKMEVSE